LRLRVPGLRSGDARATLACVDGPTAILLVLLGPAVLGLGLALTVAPARTTAALSDWYVVVPAVSVGHRIRLTLVRAAGVALIVFAVGLETRALGLFGSLLS
jgi:hypothetical protein